MSEYILKRLLYSIPTFIAVSIATFIIVQLPPGDYLTTLMVEMADSGGIDESTLQALREQYGIGQPIYVQYFKWMHGILFDFNFGISFEKNLLVTELIFDRVGWTLVISLLTLIFIWLVALPIGIYSAVRKYSPGDYIATTLGFLGLATPNFVLALVIMYIQFKVFNMSRGVVQPRVYGCTLEYGQV
ncbi:oligopeptide transport system permease protein OppB [Vibrio variabilis]|uniref:Oligopeptide transport system permease protein OppB n=1 Tax=Vibrio variabilis TaxID=990271 RepID=A0ABQ0JEV0_9VIBR|nr:oligopeptide transport system permease protein OppB [Vibrio variabilis]